MGKQPLLASTIWESKIRGKTKSTGREVEKINKVADELTTNSHLARENKNTQIYGEAILPYKQESGEKQEEKLAAPDERSGDRKEENRSGGQSKDQR